MKTISRLAVISLFFIFQGCLKQKDPCLPKTVQSEEASMQDYALTHGMTYTRHPTGLYYEILNHGTGTAITSASRVSVIYTGKFLNDTVFDQSPGGTQFFPVTGFITGWQIALPLIAKGGSMRILVPSSLAYGCVDVQSIPANSVLYFDIEVVDVQ